MNEESRTLRRLMMLVVMAAVMMTGLVGAAAAPAGAVTGITSGGSIVFIKDFNVWLTSPDGVTQRQVTTDGTATASYRDPTQSDDGTVIVALQNRNDQQGGYVRSYVYEMDRQGMLLRPAFAPEQYTTVLGNSCLGAVEGPQGILAAISPDGTKIVVNPVEDDYSVTCRGLTASYVYVMNLDGSIANPQIQPPADSTARGYLYPSWVTNTRLVMYHDGENSVHYYDLGAATAHKWVGSTGVDDNAYLYPALRGTTLATSGGELSSLVRLWSPNGGPPAAPTRRCDISTPSDENPFPRLAPDGASVVWAVVNTTGSPDFTTGIWVSPVGNIGAGDCSTINPQFLIAGASDPYWGPAPVDAPPPPPTTAAPRPLLGDFNGDGRTDIAVFRPANGTWYVRGISETVWGQPGDVPVPADYAGDAKAELAVWRPSNGTWYIRGVSETVWGRPGDIAVPANYGGDAKADIAVYRPANGTWYVRGISETVFGTAGDVPVAADYNGGGTDIAVWRPAIGTWYVRGISETIWGVPTDAPV